MKASAISEYVRGDTIAAESTPPGRGGISVIRLSGEQALSIAKKVFSNKLPSGGQFAFGKIHRLENPNHVIDHGVVLVYEKPHSYTGEDTVEFSLHGSPVVVAEVLNELFQAGARQAGPGEFTLRAYLNSKIDLTQAEAVADLIEARSGTAAEAAVLQLGGRLKSAADALSDRLMNVLMLSEIELDFSEDETVLIGSEQKIIIIDEILESLAELSDGYAKSKNIREGIDVTIIGAPNVGKSSLLNALLGKSRAIVHDTPGTTRDIVEGACVIGGVQFRFNDTAGLRAGAGQIEDEGIVRAKASASEADLVLLVRSIDMPDEIEISVERKSIYIDVLNKIDLSEHSEVKCDIGVSAKTGYNIDKLKELLVAKIGNDNITSASVINRERHLVAVREAQEAVACARQLLIDEDFSELIAEELRIALEAMDRITGKRQSEGLLDKIFAGFCIGK